jgi:hypothetical protein
VFVSCHPRLRSPVCARMQFPPPMFSTTSTRLPYSAAFQLLCFHANPNPYFANSFCFNKVQMPRGCTPFVSLCSLCLHSVSSVLIPLVLSLSNSFRITTSKSVCKQRTLTPFKINTYEKPWGGGTIFDRILKPMQNWNSSLDPHSCRMLCDVYPPLVTPHSPLLSRFPHD